MAPTRTRRSMVMAALIAIGLTILPVGEALREAWAQGGTQVSIIDFAFQPSSLVIKRGLGVAWTNTGAKNHTVASDTGLFDSGVLAPGASFTQTFQQRGTFAYHCAIHPSMTGVIKVKRDKRHRHH
jgi:plastocyanin